MFSSRDELISTKTCPTLNHLNQLEIRLAATPSTVIGIKRRQILSGRGKLSPHRFHVPLHCFDVCVISLNPFRDRFLCRIFMRNQGEHTQEISVFSCVLRLLNELLRTLGSGRNSGVSTD
mmetsp:Transcript_42936/g.167855  ORF Transcript_42936/g.167855 Transcript_42936/m.167855 type:complete len:120 (-) Transcript_42936:568-927(-)